MKRSRVPWFWVFVSAALLAGILAPFFLFGRAFDAALSVEGSVAWMTRFGPWAGLGGILLLVADLFLPIPSTVVMSALGLRFGPWWGGILAGTGSVLSGLLGYGLCRWIGQPAARWFADERSLHAGRALFAARGAWMVLLSRWMPVLPEAIACLAGLAGMPFRDFLFALVCGSFPTGFAFAAVGALGNQNPAAAMVLSIVLPIILWTAARIWERKASGGEDDRTRV